MTAAFARINNLLEFLGVEESANIKHDKIFIVLTDNAVDILSSDSADHLRRIFDVRSVDCDNAGDSVNDDADAVISGGTDVEAPEEDSDDDDILGIDV